MKKQGLFKAIALMLAIVLAVSLYQPGSARAAETSAGAYDTTETANEEIEPVEENAADRVEKSEEEIGDNENAGDKDGTTGENVEMEEIPIEESESDAEENTAAEFSEGEDKITVEGDDGNADEIAVKEEKRAVAEEADEDPEWFLPELCETITVSGYYMYPGFSAYGLTEGVKVQADCDI